MRLLIINDNTPDQVNGVVTTYSNLIRHLRSIDVNVHVIDPSCFRSVTGWFYPDLSIPVNVWRLKSLVNDYNPTHIHIATEGVLGIFAKILFDKNKWTYTTSYHTRWDKFIKSAIGFKPRGLDNAISWFHQNSNAVLVTTSGMALEVQSIGIKNPTVWTRGVDRDIFVPGSGGSAIKPTILSVGRISVEKNLEEFCNLDPNKYELRMVGDGPQLTMLKAKYPHIRFDGVLFGSELAAAYGESDVMVFTSKNDTFGIVMIESMATGTPVAAYPVRGPLEVIDQGKTGYMDADLNVAIQKCLTLNRDDVILSSMKWCWSVTTERFLSNLTPIF